MGQQICYLYEYKESVPVRNVGFIRAEQKRDGAVFSISAKGIVEHANEKLEIFGFCMKHGSCETVSLGGASDRAWECIADGGDRGTAGWSGWDFDQV